ncbi:hypothetical protein M3J09_008962 [Ascochyta lentis]
MDWITHCSCQSRRRKQQATTGQTAENTVHGFLTRKTPIP